MKTPYQTILENIPFLSEYEQKSLAIILMKFTLNEHQVDIVHNQYKTFVKDYIEDNMTIDKTIEYYKANKDLFKRDYDIENQYLYDDFIEYFFRTSAPK